MRSKSLGRPQLPFWEALKKWLESLKSAFIDIKRSFFENNSVEGFSKTKERIAGAEEFLADHCHEDRFERIKSKEKNLLKRILDKLIRDDCLVRLGVAFAIGFIILLFLAYSVWQL